MRLPTILTALFLCFAAGCGGGVDDAAAVAETGAATRLKLQLNWFAEAEHGGFYAAVVHGFYADQGLEVEIIPGGPNNPVVQALDAGRVDFAVINADRVVLGRAAEADLVAVMATMQDSPRCIMVHREQGIDSLSELANVTLAVGAGPVFYKYLALKVPLQGVETVAYPGSIGPFLANRNYAQQAYVFSEPYLARQAGADPVALMVSEIGFNPYASLLITRQPTIDERRDLVEKVVSASLRGWQQYLADPARTNAHIARINPDMGVDVLDYGATQIAQLCRVEGDNAVTLGTMTSQRWQTLIEQLTELGLIEVGSVKPEDCFTTDFLE